MKQIAKGSQDPNIVKEVYGTTRPVAIMRLSILIGFLLLASFAFSQAGMVQSVASIGESGGLVKVIPFAPVVVCGYPAVTSSPPCSNLTTTYTTPTKAGTCLSSAQVIWPGASTCKSTADASGNFAFFADTGLNYTYYFKYLSTWFGPFVVVVGGGGSAANFASPPPLGNIVPNTVAGTVVNIAGSGLFFSAQPTCLFGESDNTLDEFEDVAGIPMWLPQGALGPCSQFLTYTPLPVGVNPTDKQVPAWNAATGKFTMQDQTGGGSPGGSNGQTQYDNAGAFGGYTMGGDCTIVVATGVITCTKTNGTAFGALATTVPGTGVATFLATPSSANLLAALTTKTGTGSAVFGTAPTISSAILSTAAQLSYITGLTQCLHVDTLGNITGTGSDCGSGTVTTFSAGNLTPLFTTSVATPTTTPALSFTLSNAAANTIFGNFTGGSAAPSFNAIAACGDATHALSWVAGTGIGCQTISISALPLTSLATQAPNTVVANVTAGSASPTAAAIPSGIQNYVAGTGYNQATSHQIGAALTCADSSASGTAQSCTTSPSFTPAANDCIIYTTTTANTGASLTLNVNALGAKSVAKWQGTTTLAANDVLANKQVLACYDGTTWELSTVGNAPGGGTTSALWLPFASTGEIPVTTAAETDAVANQLSCTQFTTPIQISPTKFTVTLQTTSVGQTAQVGIYDSSLNLVRDSGALSCNTGGGTGVTATVSSFTLTPGTTYYQCIAMTDVTCAVMGVNSNSNLTAAANKNAVREFTCGNALSAGALPATCGTQTAATQKKYITLLEQ